jgi:hypothetical protein
MEILSSLSHSIARATDVTSARGGVMKGVHQGERRSVACNDVLEVVGSKGRAMRSMRATEWRPSSAPSDSESMRFIVRLLSTE